MIRMSMGGTRIRDYPLPGTPTIRPLAACPAPPVNADDAPPI